MQKRGYKFIFPGQGLCLIVIRKTPTQHANMPSHQHPTPSHQKGTEAKALAEGAIESAGEAAKAKVAAFSAGTKEAIEAAKSSKAIKSATDKASDCVTAAKAQAFETVEAAKDKTVELAGAAKDKACELATEAKESLAKEEVKAKAAGLAAATMQAGKDAAGKIGGMAKAAGTKMYEAGADAAAAAKKYVE